VDETLGNLLIEHGMELRSALHQSQELYPWASIMASATPTALGRGSHTAALADRAFVVNHTISLYLFYIYQSCNINVFSQFYTQNNISYPTLSSPTQEKFDIVDRAHPQTSEGF
jgi:hypothetical protein